MISKLCFFVPKTSEELERTFGSSPARWKLIGAIMEPFFGSDSGSKEKRIFLFLRLR